MIKINGISYMFLKIKRGNGSTNFTEKYLPTQKNFMKS